MTLAYRESMAAFVNHDNRHVSGICPYNWGTSIREWLRGWAATGGALAL